MLLPKVKAVCQDCLALPQTEERIRIENLVGPLNLMPDEKFLQSPQGVFANGFVFMSMKSHHMEYKDPKDHEKPQHRSYLIYDGNRLLGEMGTSSEAMSVMFWVKDGTLRSQLSQEVLGMRAQEKK